MFWNDRSHVIIHTIVRKITIPWKVTIWSKVWPSESIFIWFLWWIRFPNWIGDSFLLRSIIEISDLCLRVAAIIIGVFPRTSVGFHLDSSWKNISSSETWEWSAILLCVPCHLDWSSNFEIGIECWYVYVLFCFLFDRKGQIVQQVF